ncbi:MAG: carbamoyl phosphate synthase small subunit [Oscillospiraceae bacterium]
MNIQNGDEKNATLLLENGMLFSGISVGVKGETIGTLNFTTAMVGYQEAITNPNNYGVMLTQTFPLIGNYGINKFENESDKSHLNGYVIREICDVPSNYRSEKSLNEFLVEKNVVGISDIDTRRLTKIIREQGEINAMITTNEISDKDALIKKIKAYKITDAIKNTTTTTKKVFKAETQKKYSVAVLDCGADNSLINGFANMGCEVTLFPANTDKSEIINKFDFCVISDGAGNPSENVEVINTVREIINSNMKTVGIGQGHLIMAIAMGMSVEKLTYGHRGANVPVLDKMSKKTYITSQNHSYIVDEKSVATKAEVTFINANDKTIEGLSYENSNAFSFAFIPDYKKSMLSTSFVFDKLIGE